MNPLPLPLRVAAGLAATAVERTRELPTKIAGLPVTVASQALQLSMRVQQQLTELAIKGDEALSVLRPVDQTPEWATFDEDENLDDLDREPSTQPGTSAFDRAALDDLDSSTEPDTAEADDAFDGFGGPDQQESTEDDDKSVGPWTPVQQPLGTETAEHSAPSAVPGYDSLSLPQLRARLRTFDVGQLEDLLDYERTNAARPAFVGMLTRRIATVRDQT